jgi:glutamate formiminotransferase/formiminotetrahydrofolate cyclodeaminase
MLVEGRAQVSMNLTNYRETSVARTVEMVRREAARYGVTIHHSELVGLIPEEALVDAATWYLQLDQFKPDQILEHKIYFEREEASEAWGTEVEFLEALAAGSATPGGGAASAYSSAAAAALIAMVARLTIGKKKYQEVEAEMNNILEETERIRADLTIAVKRDAEAFDEVMKAFRLPKESENEAETRRAAIDRTTYTASLVPLEVGRHSARLLELALEVISKGNMNAICDAGTAAALAQAGLEGALLNVRTNAKSLQDQAKAFTLNAEADSLVEKARNLKRQCQMSLAQRGGLDLG